MFKKPDGSTVKNHNRYGITKPTYICNDDEHLFTVPHPTYLAWNYPKIIQKILEIDGPTLKYSKIKSILQSLGVPIETGFPLRGIYELQRNNICSMVRTHNDITIHLIV